jgi:hypothetical protein
MRRTIYARKKTVNGEFKTSAIKQAFYRDAKRLGMTCVEYRAYLEEGGRPAPIERNRGWFGEGINARYRQREYTILDWLELRA